MPPHAAILRGRLKYVYLRSPVMDSTSLIGFKRTNDITTSYCTLKRQAISADFAEIDHYCLLSRKQPDLRNSCVLYGTHLQLQQYPKSVAPKNWICWNFIFYRMISTFRIIDLEIFSKTTKRSEERSNYTWTTKDRHQEIRILLEFFVVAG